MSSITSTVFTGKEIKPGIVVSLYDKTLKEGADYNVVYKNNVYTGIATATVTGIGLYEGSNSVSFEIISKAVEGEWDKSTSTSVQIKWAKPSGNITGYMVYKYNSKTKEYDRIAIITNPNKVYYTVNKLQPGKTCTLKVAAYTKSGGKTIVGRRSEQIPTCTAPDKPVFKLKALSKSVSASWSKVTGATGYKFYYKTSKDGDWKYACTLSSSTLTAKKSNLVKGKTYYFKVVAYKIYRGKTIYSSFIQKAQYQNKCNFNKKLSKIFFWQFFA